VLRLCTCLISIAISIDQISFKTDQKSKYRVDLNFIFISTEKIFWKYPKFFGKKSGTNQKRYSTRANMYS